MFQFWYDFISFTIIFSCFLNYSCHLSIHTFFLTFCASQILKSFLYIHLENRWSSFLSYYSLFPLCEITLSHSNLKSNLSLQAYKQLFQENSSLPFSLSHSLSSSVCLSVCLSLSLSLYIYIYIYINIHIYIYINGGALNVMDKATSLGEGKFNLRSVLLRVDVPPVMSG